MKLFSVEGNNVVYFHFYKIIWLIFHVCTEFDVICHKKLKIFDQNVLFNRTVGFD